MDLNHLNLLLMSASAAASNLDGLADLCVGNAAAATAAGAAKVRREVCVVRLEMALEVVAPAVGFVAHCALVGAHA